MAAFVGVHHRVYVGQLDLSGHANAVDFGPLSRVMQDATTFNDGGWTCVKPGLISGEAMVRGFQDYDEDVLDDEISVGQLGSQYPITVVPNPTGTVAAGDPAWFSRGLVGTLNPLGGAKGDMGVFELGLPVDFALVQGKVAAPKAAITGNTNGTAVALGGPTADQKLYAAIHVTAYSGFTDVEFKVQSDDGAGFSTPTDRITFSTVTGRTTEIASVAGSFASETHHRIVATVDGTGSITFVAVFGVI